MAEGSEETGRPTDLFAQRRIKVQRWLYAKAMPAFVGDDRQQALCGPTRWSIAGRRAAREARRAAALA
jgi:hypothetical protein